MKQIQLLVTVRVDDEQAIIPQSVAETLCRDANPNFRLVEVCDGHVQRNKANASGSDMVLDLTDAYQDYQTRNNHLPDALHKLSGYGGESNIVERLLHEMYNPEEDFEPHVALEMVESGAFDDVKTNVDPGTWHNEDPVKALQGYAYYLFLSAIQAQCEACIKWLYENHKPNNKAATNRR